MNIILLSGGSGKRLWPLSNDIRSKQFIKIFKTDDGYESMVQRVYRQIKEVDTDASVTIATSKTQVSSIHNQLGNSVGVCVEMCIRDSTNRDTGGHNDQITSYNCLTLNVGSGSQIQLLNYILYTSRCV